MEHFRFHSTRSGFWAFTIFSQQFFFFLFLSNNQLAKAWQPTAHCERILSSPWPHFRGNRNSQPDILHRIDRGLWSRQIVSRMEFQFRDWWTTKRPWNRIWLLRVWSLLGRVFRSCRVNWFHTKRICRSGALEWRVCSLDGLLELVQLPGNKNNKIVNKCLLI